MEDFHFGDTIRKIREEKQISQYAMGVKLGMSQAKYWRIEQRKYLPAKEIIYLAAEFLDVPVEALTPPWWNPDADIVNDEPQEVYIITKVGRGVYIFLLCGLAFEVCIDIVAGPLQWLTITIAIISIAAIYYFTIRKDEI